MKRREFVHKSLLASAGTLLIPDFLSSTVRRSTGLLNNKKLIVIQLSGGNDGLNTIVPISNDLYYKYRPTISLGNQHTIKLNDDVGINDKLVGMMKLNDAGLLSIVNNVGYPNPNRSHFKSMDIWHSGKESDHQTGWIGRILDNNCCNRNSFPTAIEMDDVMSLVMRGDEKNGIATQDPKKLLSLLTNGQLDENILSQVTSNENLQFLYKTYQDAANSADYLHSKSKIYKSSRKYPDNKFGNNLKLVAELIGSGSETMVYYTSLSGFDTHSRQVGRQDNLLSNLDDSVYALVQDLKYTNKLDDTLIMIFSEFGRRVKENASGGTDHGTANNVILIGSQLKCYGLFNEMPDLAAIKNNDLIYSVDFRSIYSSILDSWLSIDSNEILGKYYNPLNLI